MTNKFTLKHWCIYTIRKYSDSSDSNKYINEEDLTIDLKLSCGKYIPVNVGDTFIKTFMNICSYVMCSNKILVEYSLLKYEVEGYVIKYIIETCNNHVKLNKISNSFYKIGECKYRFIDYYNSVELLKKHLYIQQTICIEEV